jgi:hypothetical protein
MKGVVVTKNNILRGPARVLYYSSTITGTGNASIIEPTSISDIITLGTIDGEAAEGWTDFGAVDGAVTHQRELTTEEDVVENVNAAIRSYPISVKDIIIANFAENSFENLQVAWELAGITTNETPTPNERVIPLSVPVDITARAVAFLYAKPDGKLRCHIFWDMTLGGVASGMAYAKTPKALIPVQFNAYPVLTITDSNGEPTLGKILEQIST